MTTSRSDTRAGRYYETPDGRFPSVTTILGCIGKPALINWAANVERELVLEAAADLYEDLPLNAKRMSRIAFLNTLKQRMGAVKAHEREKQKACEIGTQVHKLIEWNLHRELGQEAGEEPRISAEAAPCFSEYEKWRASVKLKPVHVEQTVWHPHDHYAGTLDLLAETDRGLAVIDFKTSKAVYDEYGLQVAAYAQALNAMKHGPVERGFIVRLPKQVADGFDAVEVVDLKSEYQSFLHVIALHRWVQKKREAWEARQGVAAA